MLNMKRYRAYCSAGSSRAENKSSAATIAGAPMPRKNAPKSRLLFTPGWETALLVWRFAAAALVLWSFRRMAAIRAASPSMAVPAALSSSDMALAFILFSLLLAFPVFAWMMARRMMYTPPPSHRQAPETGRCR